MKPLKPSMKENKRYLLIRGKSLKKNIEASILEFIGVLGMSKCGLSYIKTGKDWAVICINRQALNHVRASFAAWSETMVIERVSGTLKGLKKA